ncbi:MAG: OpgC domain-containing protein [Chloroflexi bacterium]|nr:OpgC domain-containing protein [Chloroflexota bacterium]
MKNQHAQLMTSNGAAAPGTTARTFPNLWTLPHWRPWDWSYPALGKRDLRLDLLRGFAVFVMVVNHFGGSSWLYLITGGNNFFTSGAEAFIFISGLVVGMVYGGIALKQGIRAAQLKAVQRAWTLYKLTVVLTLLFAIFSVAFQMEWAEELNITNPFLFALNIATLRQTMYLTDVPLLYTFLLLGAAGALWLLYKGYTKLLLTASLALWLAFQIAPAQVQVPWPVDGNTTFNFAAWQLLFFIAMVIGYHREALIEKLSQMPRWPYFLFLGLLFVWLAQLNGTQATFLNGLLPGLDTQVFMHDFFLKSALAPGRLIASFIVFQFAYLLVTLFWKPIWAALGWLLMPLGQNSLYAYTMHIVLFGLFYAALPYLPINILAMGTLNTALQFLAVLAIWAMIQRQFLFRIIPR